MQHFVFPIVDLTRDFVLLNPTTTGQFEIREAIACKKTLVLIHESDARFGAYDFYEEQTKAPEDLKFLTEAHESLPFRRRGYERDAMLQSVIERAGFQDLLRVEAKVEQKQQLAVLPVEVGHFDLDSFHDRPVQTQLMELLLLPKDDVRFTSCVLVHGMGGTGKSVMVVAVLQEKAIRAHFSNIYWLVVGADAVDAKLQQVQSKLHKQLTGKSTKSDDVLAKDKQEWYSMLVEAMTMNNRALVVLDDPWTPEQVRFLNPVENADTEHRLLVTTRIGGLVPRATVVELLVMGKNEAVALMLDLANIQQEVYLKEHPSSQWPPQGAYAIASECGMLPIMLTVAAQVVRSWGQGWEEAVLPLLKEQYDTGGTGASVEERVIGAGLQVLGKLEDAAAIKELFGIFAVTQEDFIHSMPIVELLWRSCCGAEFQGKQKGNTLLMRLKVRQWAQILIDHSLLLGSSTHGIHLHDIILTHLRGLRSDIEMRELQRRVVEGMVAVSAERMETTGRGLQNTGTSDMPFEGEEVDWVSYNLSTVACRVALIGVYVRVCRLFGVAFHSIAATQALFI